MSTDTIRTYIDGTDMLKVDARNAVFPMIGNGFMIYSKNLVVTTDYTATNTLTFEFDGAQEVLYFSAKEILAATNTDLNAVKSDISTAGRQGVTVLTAATNGSSLEVEIFAIIKV
jgi:hypothetical protein